MYKKLLSLSLVLVFIATIAVFLNPVNTNAEEFESFYGCDSSTDTPYYDASTLRFDKDSYTIFAKLGQVSQKTSATLYVQNQDDEKCEKLGSIEINGERWTKIGDWNNTKKAGRPRFQLSSDSFDMFPTANRPSLMLVSKTNPVCVPDTACSVNFGGEKGSLIPTGTLLNEDTLHVVNARVLKNDKINRVDYFVDNKFVYTTPNLEKFDMRYIPGGKHTLTRAVKFQSQQQLVLEKSYEKSFANDFFDSIYRFLAQNSLIYTILSIILAVLIISGLGIAIFRNYHKKHLWRLEHGFEKEKVGSEHSPSSLKLLLEKEAKLIHFSKLALWGCIGGVAVLAILIFVNTHLLQLFRVNGVSMETSLQTDDQIMVNKFPKSWAKLSNREYVPNRGEVIVFHKAKSQFLVSEGDNEETYVVKRVIGLPGERVVVKNGVITVYNKEYPTGFKPDQNSSWETNLTIDESENIDIKLSQSQIFVAGENRPESIDSRANGAVEVSEIVGHATFRVMPFSKFTKL